MTRFIYLFIYIELLIFYIELTHLAPKKKLTLDEESKPSIPLFPLYYILRK